VEEEEEEDQEDSEKDRVKAEKEISRHHDPALRHRLQPGAYTRFFFQLNLSAL